MLSTWTDSRKIAAALDRVAPDYDVTALSPAMLEALIIDREIVDKPLNPEHRENILNSILWHWMRLRDEKLQQEAGG